MSFGKRSLCRMTTPLIFFPIVANISSGLFAQEGQTFKITSFIPERFVDAEWRVDWETSYSHTGHNISRHKNETYQYYDDKFGEGAGQISLANHYRYRDETISRNIDFKVNGSIDYKWKNSHSLEDNRQSSGSWFFISNDQKEGNYSIGVAPEIYYLKYLTDKLFAGIDIYTYAGYTGYPTDNSSAKEITYNISSYDGTIYESRVTYGERTDGDSKAYSLKIALTPGWGRIYEGYYGATALYIVNELKSMKLY
jgi:hypothetical protein